MSARMYAADAPAETWYLDAETAWSPRPGIVWTVWFQQWVWEYWDWIQNRKEEPEKGHRKEAGKEKEAVTEKKRPDLANVSVLEQKERIGRLERQVHALHREVDLLERLIALHSDHSKEAESLL